MSLQRRNFIGAAEIPTEFPFDTNRGPAARFRSIFAAFLGVLISRGALGRRTSSINTGT